mmetsp:Transcript_49282/g.90903  ORF Transcript_49282/g.90903 Transcript_49282/m.90903 type:complete len:364 (-) Transcript_49282:125-1216(-)
MQQWPCALWVACKEVVPWVRVGEVRDEHPSGRVAAACSASHRNDKAPTLGQWPAKRPSAQQPHASPHAHDEAGVGKASGHPLLPELLVDFASWCLIWEVEVPLNCEEGTSVIQAKEVDEWQQGAGDDQPKWVDGKGILLVAPSPLQESVLELLRVPTELALLQEIHRARMVPVVLQDKLLPWQGEEVAEGVRKVLLPRVWGKSRSVHHIVVDIDVLDGEVGEWNAERERAKPIVVWEARQPRAVEHDEEALCHETERENVPHVHHLLWRDLREEERQLRWHGVRLVGCWEEPSCCVAAVLVVLLHGEHLGVALHLGCVRIAFIGQDALHRSNLRIILKFLTELIKVLICTIKDRDSSTATSSS